MSRLVITRRSLLASSASAGLLLIAGEAQLLKTEPGPFKQTMTTLFWVGEPSTYENDFIPNDQSYWDKDWQANYGGVDDPQRRNGHWPADFTPKQNPFYVALPFGEFTDHNELKTNARRVPWYRTGVDPLLKNRWVEINRDGRSCFAQWQDVGPLNEDDFRFVFGDALEPLNVRSEGWPRCLTGGLALSRHGRQWPYRVALRRSLHGPAWAVDGPRHRARQQPLRANASIPVSRAANQISEPRRRNRAGDSRA